MLSLVLNWLKNLPKELVVMIVGALPISELRGAIPLGLSFGMSMGKAFLLSVTGNLIPVIPLLLFLEPISQKLRRFKIWSRFFDWLFERTRNKADVIQKYEALGLAIFVAIPLPMTGAWTGAIAASLFKIRFKYAFVALLAGVLGAGMIVASLCALGIMGWKAVIH